MTNWKPFNWYRKSKVRAWTYFTNHSFVFKCQFAPEKFSSVKYDTVQCSLFLAEFVAFHKLLQFPFNFNVPKFSVCSKHRISCVPSNLEHSIISEADYENERISNIIAKSCFIWTYFSFATTRWLASLIQG